MYLILPRVALHLPCSPFSPKGKEEKVLFFYFLNTALKVLFTYVNDEMLLSIVAFTDLEPTSVHPVKSGVGVLLAEK